MSSPTHSNFVHLISLKINFHEERSVGLCVATWPPRRRGAYRRLPPAGPGRGLAVCGPRSFKVTGVRFAAIENLAGIGGGGQCRPHGKSRVYGKFLVCSKQAKKGPGALDPTLSFPFLSSPFPPSFSLSLSLSLLFMRFVC